MIIAWKARDLMKLLDIGPEQTLTGVRLTLDGEYVELRVVSNESVERLVYTLVERHGNVCPV